MNCPHCNTENPETNQFCMNCGKLLTSSEDPNSNDKSIARRFLFTLAAQTILIVLLLFIFRSILNSLDFIQELQISNWRITTPEIISVVMFLIILGILVVFARSLINHWPIAFPRFAGVGVLLTAIVYLLVLSIIYSIVKPFFISFISEPEPILILRIFLTVVAIVLVGWALVVAYQSLPDWLDNIRASLAMPVYKPAGKKD